MSNYCRAIHAGLSIRVMNEAVHSKPCCFAKYKTTEHSFTTMFSDMRESNKHNKLDLEICSQCIESEQHGDQSKRLGLIQLNDRVIYDYSGPEILDIALDYTCNLACMTCGPDASSYWSKFSNEAIKPLNNNFNKLKEILDDLDLSMLQSVQMIGGETFLSANNIKFLEYLDKHTDVSKINIMYHTNGTIIPGVKVLKLLSKFKMVELYFSIDGINESFNYIRFPADWTTLQENLAIFKEKMPGNTLFKVEVTVSLLNLHLIDEIKEWFNNGIINENRYGDNSYLVTHMAHKMFSIDNISKKHADWIRYIDVDSKKYIRNNTKNINVDIVEFITSQDNKRNINIDNWFPEFLSFYK